MDVKPDSAIPLVCLIAGEPSGDLLGARLMAALLRLCGGRVRFMGVGGEAMAGQGLDSLVDLSELAVMGFIEVLPRAPLILRRVREVAEEIRRQRPAVVITIDSWGFCKRVHQAVRTLLPDVPRLHYVAPMVWAWKEKRAQDVAATVDHLLCLLPDEPRWFTPFGLKTTHVGHPVVEGGAGRGDAAAFRQRHGLGDSCPLLAVLPGSRRSETSRLLPVFELVVGDLLRQYPETRVVVPTVATVAPMVEETVASWPGQPLVVRGEAARYDAFAAAQAALAASGTVSLELALAGVPHLIAYRVAPLTAWIFRRLSSLRYANLINMTLDRMVIPELLQEDCTADKLLSALLPLWQDEDCRRSQRAAFASAVQTLAGGEGSPSERAARVVLDYIQR